MIDLVSEKRAKIRLPYQPVLIDSVSQGLLGLQIALPVDVPGLNKGPLCLLFRGIKQDAVAGKLLVSNNLHYRASSDIFSLDFDVFSIFENLKILLIFSSIALLSLIILNEVLYGLDQHHKAKRNQHNRKTICKGDSFDGLKNGHEEKTNVYWIGYLLI